MFLYFLLLVIVRVSNSQETGTWIKSPETTSWGKWGASEECPQDHFVSSLKIKYETKLVLGDDTALNGIQLYCTPLTNLTTIPNNEDNKKNPQNYLTSSTGEFGEWLKESSNCFRGLATGFQLKSEVNQGSSDDTGANDVILKCINVHGREYTTAKGNGGEAGSWTEETNCPKGSGICGIRTQVEENQGKGDDTSLNNVAMKCCKIPDYRSGSCVPQEMVEVSEHIVPAGGSVKFGYSVGVSREVDDKVGDKQGIVEAIAFNNDKDRIIRDLGKKIKTVKSEHVQEVFSEEREKIKELKELPGNCRKIIVKQRIIKCDTFLVRLPEMEFDCEFNNLV